MRTCALIVLYLFYSPANHLATSPICPFLISLLLRLPLLPKNNACRQLPNNVDRFVTTQTDTVAV